MPYKDKELGKLKAKERSKKNHAKYYSIQKKWKQKNKDRVNLSNRKSKAKNAIQFTCKGCGKKYKIDSWYAKRKKTNYCVVCRAKIILNQGANPEKSPLLNQIRNLKEAVGWRRFIFARDDFTCQICYKRQNLAAHHLKPFKQIINENNIKTLEQARKCQELWNVGNGITFCEDCHIEIHCFKRQMIRADKNRKKQDIRK